MENQGGKSALNQSIDPSNPLILEKKQFRYDLVIFWFVFFIPIIMWLMMLPLSDRIGSLSSTLRSIGQLTALIGVNMMAFSMIFQTRLTFLNKLFLKPKSVYNFHHYFGIISLLLLLVHPLVLATRYLGTSLNFAYNFLYTSSLVNLLPLVALFLMIVSIYTTLFTPREFRFWKLFHQILLIAYIFVFYHLIFVKSDISINMALRVYVIGVFSLGGLSFLVQKTNFYYNNRHRKDEKNI